MGTTTASQSWQRFGAATFLAVGAVFSTVAACTTTVDEVSTPVVATVTLSDGGSRALPISCTDGQKNNDETDVDCGGKTCAPCSGNKTCSAGSDCVSTICGTNDQCTFATPHDGAKNGSETDVDCGGASTNPRCATGKGCEAGGDCVAMVCGAGMTCVAPSPTDTVKNGGETDVDCGGANTAGSDKAPACGQGKGCSFNTDCTSTACSPTAHTCVPASAMDGFQDGSETDVDCGGTGGATACASGKMCKGATDCSSAVCAAGTCAAPSATDGVKNGGETDVDCGGVGTMNGDGAPTCASGKTCAAHADCASNGCDATMHCALAPSCTAIAGGLSCGSGETGQAGAVHESCCTALPVTSGGKTFLLDKYVVTAGRMRQFIDRNQGNIRAYVQANRPAGWQASWDAWVPDDYEDDASDMQGGVYTQLGSFAYGAYGAGNEGCVVKNEGARTFRLTDAINTSHFNDTQSYDATLTDEKAENCTPWLLYYAFCAWDGGHLQTNAEFQSAWHGTDNRTYPWGSSPGPAGWGVAYPDAVSAMQHPATPMAGGTSDSTITNWLQNYWWPAEMVGTDYSIYLSAPGRFPRNAGPYGHMDLGGLAMEATSTFTGSGPASSISTTWASSGSWQGHALGQAFSFPATNKYIAQTGRCAR